MIKPLRVIVITLFIVSLMSCETNRMDEAVRTESLSQDETKQVDSLLQNLYQSFSYGNTEEPDWELMQSLFIEGAQFVTEAPEGEKPKTQTIEKLISSWQNSIRDSDSSTIETTEQILEINAAKIGNLIRVDVLFQASKSNDTAPKKPGLDTLLLANVDGAWKILSFVVQYESKI